MPSFLVCLYFPYFFLMSVSFRYSSRSSHTSIICPQIRVCENYTELFYSCSIRHSHKVFWDVDLPPGGHGLPRCLFTCWSAEQHLRLRCARVCCLEPRASFVIVEATRFLPLEKSLVMFCCFSRLADL